MTIETAADRIVNLIEADLASLSAVGCRDWQTDQNILGWAQRIAAQIECIAILLGKDCPTVETLEIDLGRAITAAKVNLYKRDHNITA